LGKLPEQCLGLKCFAIQPRPACIRRPRSRSSRDSAVTADGAVFNGGSTGKFDAIIFATGYRPNYRSFLESDDVKTRNGATADRGKADSTIRFVGFENSVTGLLRDISRDAVRIVHNIVRQRNEPMRRSA
jgi:hypothetical protein